MGRQQFIAAAQSSPLPNVRQHVHTYNCHMAAVNWALRSRQRTQTQAVLTVDRLAAQHCLMCTTRDFNMHQTMAPGPYEERFCGNKQQLLRNAAFDGQVTTGDVILIGVPGNMTHSMVAVRVEAGEIYIRGFNNAGSFAAAVDLRGVYDDQDRRLTTSNYWQDANSYWYVDYDDFVQPIDALLQTESRIENTIEAWMG